MMRSVANLTAGCLAVAYSNCAGARSYPIGTFDGAWQLIFETQSGSCDLGGLQKYGKRWTRPAR